MSRPLDSAQPTAHATITPYHVRLFVYVMILMVLVRIMGTREQQLFTFMAHPPRSRISSLQQSH